MLLVYISVPKIIDMQKVALNEMSKMRISLNDITLPCL